MKHLNIYNLLAVLAVACLAVADPSNYLFMLQDSYSGDDFFDGFDFVTFDDPTHGRVNYVSQETATRTGLSYGILRNIVSGQFAVGITPTILVAYDSKFFMRADDRNMVSSGARGRDSIRIQSRAAYSDSIIVLDLKHMPEGCSTWPAFWTNSATGPWPRGGEIDVFRTLGVNKDSRNLASQHTAPGCTVLDPRPMTGQGISSNCDARINFNQGCGVRFNKPNSYGETFNAAGGGWYVMRRTADDGVSVWFWSRNDVKVPRALRRGELLLQSDESWGLPEAYFPTTSCSGDHFDAHQIIFDLTFCGDWAGSTYNTSGCPGTCSEFVNDNPSAFSDAYWEINSLRIYTPM